MPVEPEAPRAIAAGEQVVKADLVPGRIIERWTDTTATGIRVPMPCHERQFATAALDTISAVVVCRICSETYEMVLEPDFDGGHFAVLTVAHMPFLLSRQSGRNDTKN